MLVSLVSSAPKWHVRTASGDVGEGELAGMDAIHGLALLRTNLPAPHVTLPIATDVPLASVEPLIGMQASATGGEVRLLAKAVSASSYDEMLDDASLRPGEVALDTDGRVRAFGAETEAGPAPLHAYALAEIVRALSTTGRHQHPWLGAELQTVEGPLRSYFTAGALVTVHVEPDSPADRAGFKPGMAFVEAREGDRTAHTREGVDNILEVGQTIEFEPVPAPRQTAPPKPVSVTVEDRQAPLPVGTHGVGLVRPDGERGAAGRRNRRRPGRRGGRARPRHGRRRRGRGPAARDLGAHAPASAAHALDARGAPVDGAARARLVLHPARAGGRGQRHDQDTP